jgi:hypothetical protein
MTRLVLEAGVPRLKTASLRPDQRLVDVSVRALTRVEEAMGMGER